MVYLGFRVDRKPLDDPRVRQAMAMTVNAGEINTQLLGGLGRLADGIVAPEVFGHATATSRPAYDPGRARQLLAEAGQSNLTLRMGLSNGRFVNDRQIGEAIGAYLEQAGVRVELDAPEFGAFFREISSPTSKYDAYVISWGTNTLDADFTMSAVFHEKFSTYTMYRNKDVSALIDQARGTVDEREARTLYQRIQETLMRDLPWIPLILVPDVVGVRRSVEGLELRADELVFFWGVTPR
jgi:peptide/nickel transport system substrate-binding protein